MKRLSAMLLLFAVCMFLSAGSVLAEPSMPDLTGKWVTRSYGHHHEQKGMAAPAEAEGAWVVKEQQGRLFHGERTYTKKYLDGSKVTEGFSGVISRDGKHLYLVDHEEDILFGEILDDGSIELIVMNDGDENHHSRIGLLEIQRAK